MRSTSRRPCRSNRQSSTFSALAENSAKFVPRPSHVAPKGCGRPGASRKLRLGDEKNCSKGRNNKADLGNRAPVQRPHHASVPDIAAAVKLRISVENLAPGAGKRHLDAVITVDFRSEINHDQAALLCFASFAQPGENAPVSVVHDQPFEPRPITVELMQGR